MPDASRISISVEAVPVPEPLNVNKVKGMPSGPCERKDMPKVQVMGKVTITREPAGAVIAGSTPSIIVKP